MSDAEIHGLVYPPAFLDALPVLHHRPDPHQPIRALSAADFARIHLAHLTSHAPDHVLFPFLHGLEGDNDAQNSFFAASHSPGSVPRFRGLIWVACDEDDDVEDNSDLDDLDDDDDEDDEVDSCSTGSSLGPSDIDDDVPMDIDPSIAGPLVQGCPPPELDLKLSPPLVSAAPPVPRNGRLPSPRAHSHTHHPAFLTSSFRPRELIRTKTNPDGSTSPVFIEPKIPHGISLRNFGIQVPIYATLCDIVVYSPKGLTRSALAVAHKFKQAVETKHDERRARCSSLVPYNVFVLEATPADMMSTLRHLVARMEPEDTGAHTDGPDAHTRGESTEERRVLRPNTIDFAQREKEEMRDLTQASEIVTLPDDVEDAGAGESPLAGSTTSSHWDPMRGQVFLGNSNDVPLPPDRRIRMRTLREDDGEDAFDWRTNDPAQGFGYDICIECHDYAPFPTSAHLRAAEEHMRILDRRWVEKCLAEMDDNPETLKRLIPPRPPPNAAYVVHLPLPSSPASSVVTLNTLVPFLSFLEKLIQPLPGPPLTYELACEQLAPPSLPSRPSGGMSAHVRRESTPGFHPSSLPPPSSFPTSFFPSPASPQSAYTRVRSTSATFLPSSPTSSSCSSSPTTLTSSPTDSTAPVALRTRPAKLLIYSADGYTESSVLALSMLMSLRTLSLPEAYLTLQVEKRRSFFVYQSDLSLLRRIEARLEKDRTASKGGTTPKAQMDEDSAMLSRRPSAQSVSPAPERASAAHPTRTRSESEADVLGYAPGLSTGRPRAQTMPPQRGPTPGDHQVWFNDPRFDGSFPSRVLPFLYLGNLNHASNAFMLHALGITHVVSVGECALVPPSNVDPSAPASTSCTVGPHFIAGKGPGGHGSLWMEEREGRIKVLDIKGVCDDGIDTLEPQLEPICDWIEKARAEGGKVLVHCRVGVSRSATVTIAYVMKHLSLPLVDAYLIVRSRRLSVLIQPNMRLLYNLLGWEVKLARERAGDDPERLRQELARSLNWPYLAKEVHLLNEKYLPA